MEMAMAMATVTIEGMETDIEADTAALITETGITAWQMAVTITTAKCTLGSIQTLARLTSHRITMRQVGRTQADAIASVDRESGADSANSALQ
jgi:hypothetical protein